MNHMSLSGTLLSCCSLVMLCCLCVGSSSLTNAAFGQESDAAKPDNKPARSAVRGRVLFSDSEQPVRRATVRLRKEFNRDFLKRTVSTKRGEFSFQGVPAGTYYVDVDVPGIVSQSSGVGFSDFGLTIEETNVALVTVDGVNDVKTEVRVIRGGAITGRVSYSDGEPATQARIVLFRQKDQKPVLFFPNIWEFTDDRGIYRIEGLPSGEYFVGAVENNSGGRNQYPRDAAGLVTAFHPSAYNLGAATLVSVQGGSEARDVHIKFGDDPRRISGTLKWKQGDTPVTQGVVFLQRIGDPPVELDYRRFSRAVMPERGDKTDMLMGDLFFLSLLSTNAPYVELDDNGDWSFTDLPPGTYSLSAVAPVPVERPGKPRRSIDSLPELDLEDDDTPDDYAKGVVKGAAEVTIKDKNVENLVIEVSEGSSIVGSVVSDGDLTAPVGVTLNLGFRGLQSIMDNPNWVGVDKTFVIRSVPAGRVRLDIVEPRETNYYIRSITGKGLDLLKEPLTIAEGEQVSGVQVVLGTDLATVEGRIVQTAGGGVAGGGVVLMPVDQRRWTTPSMRGLARADAEGRFSMRLAPGEYLAVAWRLRNEPTVPLDSYVRSHLLTARRVTLQPNETRTLEVTAPDK